MRKMFKKLAVPLLCLAILLTAVAGCQSAPASTPAPAPAPKPEAELLISAAASLTDVMAALIEDYKTVAPEVTITPTFGSSGTLQTQIEEGAPADLFLSAGKKQMTALADKNLLLTGTNTDLLENKVVLIVPKDSGANIASFEDLATDKVKVVALGEPTGVPVGQYSEEVFKTLGILDAVKAKANYASDVRQVLTWVESGEVDCGVVYETDAKTSDSVKVVCPAPEGSHAKIIYPAAAIAATSHPDEARAFLEYLAGDAAAKIFKDFGFTVI